MSGISSITSDRDYLELVTSGDTTINANTNPHADSDGQFPNTAFPFSGPTDYGNAQTITHNIGSVPIVRVWFDSDKNGRLYNTIRNTTGDYLALVQRPHVIPVSTTTTTKLLTMSPVSETNVPVHYRIYRFGTKGLTSDEVVDKIFDSGLDNKTLGAAADSLSPVLATTTIAHGQGEQILWKLQFSLDQSTWYDEGAIVYGSPDTSSGPPGGPYARYYYHNAYASADATNFYVTYLHNHPSSQTIYTRWVWEYK